MNNIENIFMCLAAPLLIASTVTKERGRRLMIFMLTGMASCLFSSYISTFIAAAQGADVISASLEISPFVEEIMKLFPLIFYILVFEPTVTSDILDACMMTAIGFATLENVCFLMTNGSEDIIELAIRGFGTGTMHVVCASFVAFGLLHLWNRLWLRVAGTVAFLCAATTFHGVFNVLVSQTGIPMYIGFIIPVATTVGILVLRKRLKLRGII
ncbi:MAG: PrsW family intramembrane metalloprotease [Lachnospiraceae bacterium]|nr:PrsW family intramembrane metalloprotease [Lachnospiraceae bacterium]